MKIDVDKDILKWMCRPYEEIICWIIMDIRENVSYKKAADWQKNYEAIIKSVNDRINMIFEDNLPFSRIKRN